MCACTILPPDAHALCSRCCSFSHSGGARRLAITVERANLDYRKPLDRPVFCISLHDADGRPLETPQDTPPGHFDRGRRCVSAGHTVILRTPMRQMPPGTCRISQPKLEILIT